MEKYYAYYIKKSAKGREQLFKSKDLTKVHTYDTIKKRRWFLMVKKSNKLELGFKIERSNELNTLSPRGLNLTEVRFLAIYQSKINARNPDTRIVTFPLAEFCKIMEIGQLTVTYIKNIADNIICKPIHLPSESGRNGFMAVPLFTKCEVYQDDNTMEWFVKIKCSEEVFPYMFQMKKNYFTYELWNALKLKSINQIRMYELLKQYGKIGERILTIDDLKCMLGISLKDYVRYQDFRTKVIEVCQRALEQYTDIKYVFEPIRRGRKIYALKFTITKNKNFKDDLRLKEFIKPEDLEDIKDISMENIDKTVESSVDSTLESLYYRCSKAYTMQQLEMIRDYINNSGVKLNVSTENYIYSVYANIKMEGNKVNNLFKYTIAVVRNQINDYIFAPNRQKEPQKTQEQKSSYNI